MNARPGVDRAGLLRDLSRRLAGGTAALAHQARFWRLKYARHARAVVLPLLKRSLDVLVAATMLLLLSPLFAVVALLIKLTDGGPVLFWQKRVGRWGREFPFPKFRSMVVNAEQLKAALLARNDHGGGVTFKMKRDPRITWIGRIIRRLSIDELPQLWCVLRGDMSLVGPRPPVPSEVAKYTLEDRRRLDVVPGLTCIWQVSGRGTIPFPQQVAMDAEYIERRGPWLDFVLLLRTIPAVLTGRGAF
jgi:lipopolysaccharide/colanic/teichoic acid biosynthesis glycosyltransferase